MSNITKTAMITVCGRPNVGKSSLTNALVGEKVAIVSNKAQTTRNRIYGIVNREDTQYILLDTPGLHKPKSALGDRPHPGGKDPLHPVHQQDRHCGACGVAAGDRGLQRGVGRI